MNDVLRLTRIRASKGKFFMPLKQAGMSLKDLWGSLLENELRDGEERFASARWRGQAMLEHVPSPLSLWPHAERQSYPIAVRSQEDYPRRSIFVTVPLG